MLITFSGLDGAGKTTQFNLFTNYLSDGERNCDLSHLPDSCKDSNHSCDVILFHFLVSFSLILCSSFIKSGSSLFCILHLLRRTEVYLWPAKFLINPVNFYACFVLYNMFKIPADKYRYIMDCTTSNMKGIRSILSGYNLVFYVIRSQCFNFFYRYYFRAVKYKMPKLNRIKELFGYLLDSFVSRIQPIYDRGIYINPHKLKIT